MNDTGKVLMYKLVTREWTTHGDMKWEIGKTNKATGAGNRMCTDGVLHCYADPRLAVVFNSLHAEIPEPRLLAVECSEIIASDGLKYACKEQTPLRELPLPVLSTRRIVAFGVRCALAVYQEPSYVRWTEGWLTNGGDAKLLYEMAQARARARRTLYTSDAAYAAYAAAYAAKAATYAAYASDAADATYAAAYAADVATDAAKAAAYATTYAAYAAADAADAAADVATDAATDAAKAAYAAKAATYAAYAASDAAYAAYAAAYAAALTTASYAAREVAGKVDFGAIIDWVVANVEG